MPPPERYRATGVKQTQEDSEALGNILLNKHTPLTFIPHTQPLGNSIPESREPTRRHIPGKGGGERVDKEKDEISPSSCPSATPRLWS